MFPHEDKTMLATRAPRHRTQAPAPLRPLIDSRDTFTRAHPAPGQKLS